MKKNILLFGFFFIALISVSMAQTASGNKMENPGSVVPAHRVIMQMVTDDTLAHKALMMQLKNLKDVWADSVEIEVLVQGPALDMVMTEKSSQKENILSMKKKGVNFAICEFSMKNRKLTKEQIMPEMNFVKYGLVEIINKQEQGWVYLKAGF